MIPELQNYGTHFFFVLPLKAYIEKAPKNLQMELFN
jgi:hypothetical protein